MEGTFEVDVPAWSMDLRLSADGEGIVAWAGAVPVRMLADRTGLTQGLSGVLARRGFDPLHDRGRVLTDVAVAIACGARDIVDVEALRAQQQVFGPGRLGHHRPAGLGRDRWPGPLGDRPGARPPSRRPAATTRWGVGSTTPASWPLCCCVRATRAATSPPT